MAIAAKGGEWVLIAGVLTGGLLTSGVWAEEAGWVKLSGPQIEAALDDRKLKYKTATQVFYKSGKTLYDAGRPSWGNWRIQGDEYCSQWPPNAGWDCYGFERRLNESNGSIELRFVSKTGHITDAVYLE